MLVGIWSWLQFQVSDPIWGKKQHDITNQRASELSDPILHFLLRDLPISTKTGSILCDIILTSDDVHCLEPGSSNSEDVSSHLFLAHVLHELPPVRLLLVGQNYINTYPPVIKRGNGKSPINGRLQGNFIVFLDKPRVYMFFSRFWPSHVFHLMHSRHGEDETSAESSDPGWNGPRDCRRCHGCRFSRDFARNGKPLRRTSNRGICAMVRKYGI
jgi:hypothetical protein